MSGTMTNSRTVTPESSTTYSSTSRIALRKLKIPLLAHNFSKRASAIRGPSRGAKAGVVVEYGLFTWEL